MSDTSDLLVVGGGIAGLTTALAATSLGLTVRIVDSTLPGSASRASAGVLAPSIAGLAPHIRSIALEARDYYTEFLARLRERADIDVPLDRNGILQLASAPAELEILSRNAPRPAEILDARALGALEPALQGHSGAILYPHDGAVDNAALMRALDLVVSRESRITRVCELAVGMDFSAPLPRVVTHAGKRYHGAAVLLASGAWANGLPGLPRPLPVRPVRGQLLTLHGPPIRHVIFTSGGYLVPRASTLLVGATSEEAGFAHVTTDEGHSILRNIAEHAIPTLASAVTLDHWAGLRPITPDALPILGRDPQVPTLVYACGFSRNGILLAPWAAQRLAALLAGADLGDSLAWFSVERPNLAA